MAGPLGAVALLLRTLWQLLLEFLLQRPSMLPVAVRRPGDLCRLFEPDVLQLPWLGAARNLVAEQRENRGLRRRLKAPRWGIVLRS